jgi:hypothetical protein
MEKVISPVDAQPVTSHRLAYLLKGGDADTGVKR